MTQCAWREVLKSESTAMATTGFSREHLIRLFNIVKVPLRSLRDRGPRPRPNKRICRNRRYRWGRPMGAHPEDRLLWTLMQLHHWRSWNVMAYITNRAKSSLVRDFDLVVAIINSHPLLDNVHWYVEQTAPGAACACCWPSQVHSRKHGVLQAKRGGAP